MVLLYLLALAASMCLTTVVVFFAPGFISMGITYLLEHKSVLIAVVLIIVICFAVKLMA